MKNSILNLIIFCAGIFVIYMWFINSEMYNLKCIISAKDGNKYCVRDREGAQLNKAANLLAEVATRCTSLVSYCKQKYPNNEDVKRLVERFNANKIIENLPTSEYTSYTENKGDKIAFCIDKDKGGNRLIDINTLTFVAIHELAHIMTIKEDHPQIFWKNYKFLLENAVDCGIYNPHDYKKNPKKYCSMQITDNPLYDLK